MAGYSLYDKMLDLRRADSEAKRNPHVDAVIAEAGLPTAPRDALGERAEFDDVRLPVKDLAARIEKLQELLAQARRDLEFEREAHSLARRQYAAALSDIDNAIKQAKDQELEHERAIWEAERAIPELNKKIVRIEGGLEGSYGDQHALYAELHRLQLFVKLG